MEGDCKNKEKFFINNNNLQKHKRQQHQLPGLFICPTCDPVKGYNSKAALKAHTEAVHGQGNYKFL